MFVFHSYETLQTLNIEDKSLDFRYDARKGRYNIDFLSNLKNQKNSIFPEFFIIAPPQCGAKISPA